MDSSAPPRGPAHGRSQRAGAALLRPRPADRVAADAERDLDGRPRRQPGRRRAGHPAALLPRRRRLRPRLGDGHARRPLLADVGQGDPVRRLPRLDPGPDRGGDRARRRRRLLRRPGRRFRRGDVRRRRARLADGLLHPGPGRGARGRVQGRLGHAAGQGGATFDRPDLRQGRRNRRFRTAGAGDLRDRRPDDLHRVPAGMARAKRAFQRGRPAPPRICNQSSAGCHCHPAQPGGLRIHE